MPYTTNPIIAASDTLFADKSRSAFSTKIMLQDAVDHINMQIETLLDVEED